MFLSKETIYFTGVRAGQSIDVILIPYIELTLSKDAARQFQAKKDFSLAIALAFH